MINLYLYRNRSLNLSYRTIAKFLSCVSIEKKENVLFLQNPKLVYSPTNQSISNDDYLSPSPMKTLTPDINASNLKSSLSNVNKFDKKYKNNFKQESILNERKNKGKLKKKIRDRINLEKDDIFLNPNSNRVLTKDVIDQSIEDPLKISKYKKKQKTKQGISDRLIDYNENNEIINKEIILDSSLTVQELAEKLNIPETEIIRGLFLKGISVTVNQTLDISLATQVVENYHFQVIKKTDLKSIKIEQNKDQIDNSTKVKRPPVVTILGHVDHGKTTILDSIRKTNLVRKEVGGITQAITGYEVDWMYNSSIYKLVFLDTPGHEAFESMRLLGTQVTDIVILVVAADDGLKPQTIEAIKNIKSRDLPVIVAINKIDKSNINVQKIIEDLAQYEIVCENWGGNVPVVEVSALTGKNIDTLLSNICILSDLQDLKADPNCFARGTVLEAHLDRTKGAIANILVQEGTLKIGDIIISNNVYGRVKVITDNQHIKIKKAKPSSIVEILGFSKLPQAGANFQILNNEKKAKQIINNQQKNNYLNPSNSLNSRIKVNNILNIKKINIILKADTQGSVEALMHSFANISQNKVQINILSFNAGNISDTDLEFALTSQSLIIGFNINIPIHVHNTAKRLGITLKKFSIIYDLLDYIKEYMLNLIEPEYDEILMGSAIVQSIFTVNKGIVAGCLVTSGKLKKQAQISVYRDKTLVYNGMLNSLKRLKDDVDEVNDGNECGIMCNDYNLWNQKDTIEAYELIEKPKEL